MIPHAQGSAQDLLKQLEPSAGLLCHEGKRYPPTCDHELPGGRRHVWGCTITAGLSGSPWPLCWSYQHWSGQDGAGQ